MNKNIHTGMKNRVKRIAFIVFILLMFFMFTGCVACAAPGDSSSLYNKNGVPFFSVGLEYSRKNGKI